MKMSAYLPIRCAIFAFYLSRAAMLFAQGNDQVSAIDWKKGPAVGDLGGFAQIKVPEGFLLTDQKGAQKLLELTHNIPDGYEVGAVVPEDGAWFVIFEFNETGFIKDEEKDKIDADALLKSLQDGTEESNEARKEKGWPAFHITGWQRPPFYDQSTNNLTWAIRGRNDTGGQSVNHSIRLLGRRGTMNVDLVLGPDEYAQVVPRFNSLMSSFSFREGHRYSDFVAGDKVASYGLTALIAGGVGAVAVKTGLLAKMWKVLLPLILLLKKLILFVLVGALAAIKRFISWLRGKPQEVSPAPTKAGLASAIAQSGADSGEIISLNLAGSTTAVPPNGGDSTEE